MNTTTCYDWLKNGKRVSVARGVGVLLALVLAVSCWQLFVQAGPASADGTGTGGDFVPLTPQKLVDTSTGVGGSSKPFAAGEIRTYQVTGKAGAPATGVAAVMLNVEALDTTGQDNALYLGRAAATVTPLSVLRFDPLTAPRSATAVSALSAQGAIQVQNAVGVTNLRISVVGYFTAPNASGASPGGFTAVTPTRIVNTTSGVGAAVGQVATGKSLLVQVTGRGGVPSTATAVFASLGVTYANTDGSVSMYAADVAAPALSQFTYSQGGPEQNGVMVPLSADGKIKLLNNGSSGVHFTLDIQGYVDGNVNGGGGYHAMTPAKMYASGSGTTMVPAGQTKTFAVAGNRGFPIQGADSVLATVIAKGYTADGNVELFPSGKAPTGLGSISFNDAETGVASGTAVSKLGSDGRLSVKNGSTAPVEIRVVTQGWFATNTAAPGDGFMPTVQTDVLDTSTASTPVTGQQTRTVSVLGLGDPEVPEEATAVYVNVSVSDQTDTGGVIRVGAAGTSVSTTGFPVPYAPGERVTAALRIPVSSSGLSVYSSDVGSSANVKISLQGYYVPNGALFHAFSTTVSLTGTANEGYLSIPANSTQTISLTGNAAVPSNAEVLVIRAFVRGWTTDGSLAIVDPDDVDEDGGARSMDYGGDDSNPLTSTVIVQSEIETGNLNIRNSGSSAIQIKLDGLGWYSWSLSTGVDPVDTGTTNTNSDAAMQDILALEPGTTADDVLEGIQAVSADSGSTTAQATTAIRDMLADDSDEVGQENAGYDPGATMNSHHIVANSGSSIKPKIHLPQANHWGDVVYAPNNGKYYTHGHAALYSNKRTFVEAPGSAGVVERDITDAKDFAVGAKMMSVYTDDGNGPLLSLKKRKKGISWARSRRGDIYRKWTRPNAKLVAGKIGTKANAQNCSQLVWGAYLIANGYDFNRVEVSALVSPVLHAVDKAYILPKEIMSDPHTHVYATVTTDYGQ